MHQNETGAPAAPGAPKPTEVTAPCAPTRAEIAAQDGLRFPGRSYVEAVLSPIYESAKHELLEPMMAVHRAHLVMLVEQGLVAPASARKILAALDAIDLCQVASSSYNGRYEDLFFYVEDLTLQAAGEEAGNLHIARSRNDMGVTMYRMVLRKYLLDALEAALLLHRVLLRLAAEEADTVMLAHTHTQPAQPTTLGHWLTAAADVLERDIARLQAAYERANRSPMGAAALSTSGFPISRERVAELLGFDGLVENSYDAIAGADYVSEAAAAAQLTALHTGRAVQDLLTWCTFEYGVLRVADPYVQTSSIMPQKRNPVSLEHSRALLSCAAGRAQTVLQMLHNTPFGDIVDTEDEMQPNLWAALATLRTVFRLLANVLGTAEVNRELLLERARASFANITELADLLVREAGLPFRTAHSVAAALVKLAEAKGIRDVRQVEPGLVEEAALQVLGRPLGVPAEKLRQALDPVHFVAVRTVRGGVAPAEVRRMIGVREAHQAELTAWLAGARSRLEAAAGRLAEACRSLAGAPGAGGEAGGR
ncbi:argininosuccinate lyase [Symbiobacterium terraclitae]|uniref:argininosuccinate lyase n=1 Tax=Symbiobacterium terraclitae TaxID=557451 RepID=UPI0035B51C7E